MDVKYPYIRSKIPKKITYLHSILSKDNIEDIFTKQKG